jgi:hypothetical protein
MPLTDEQLAYVAGFREYIEQSIADDDRYGELSRHDRPDGSLLASRFQMGEKCWLEIALRPFVPQIRIGFLTNDRWKSEEAEELIESSGDSMTEFVELGFSDAGLDWVNPPVEHFREAGEFFYFATPLDIDDLRELEGDEVRDKVQQMVEGFLLAFGAIIGVPDGE